MCYRGLPNKALQGTCARRKLQQRSGAELPYAGDGKVSFINVARHALHIGTSQVQSPVVCAPAKYAIGERLLFGRYLLDGDIAPGRSAARSRVSLQPEPPERRNLAGSMCRNSCGEPPPVRARLFHSASDEIG